MLLLQVPGHSFTLKIGHFQGLSQIRMVSVQRDGPTMPPMGPMYEPTFEGLCLCDLVAVPNGQIMGF